MNTIMGQSLLQRVVQGLRIRHTDLLRWFSNADESEISRRLGRHSRSAVRQEIQGLAEAIDRGEKGNLGECEVCHEQVNDHLLEMDYAANVCLEHLDSEQRSQLENELELSRKVQLALLPRSAPAIPGWEMSAFSQPASIVGGDYFDFLEFGDKAHAIIIADVMGKGVPASMLMANLQASLRIIVPESTSPADVVVRLNRLFHHNITLTKFVSLFVCHLDPLTGSLSYVNAGHHPPFLIRQSVRKEMEFISLRPTGPAIGLVESAAYELGEITIHKGNLLVLYTDGIVEARSSSEEEFGEKRLKAIVDRLLKKSVSEVAQEIRDQLRSFSGRSVPDDDSTLIVCRRTAD